MTYKKMMVVKNTFIIVFSVILIAVSAFTIFPDECYAYNGYLEDCDFDGYDDETNAPVPWYGFDETKGDEIPSAWDGKAGSYAFISSEPDVETDVETPSSKSTKESESKPVSKPASTSTTEPESKSVSKSTSTTEPTSKSTKEPESKPASTPTTELESKPAPTSKSTGSVTSDSEEKTSETYSRDINNADIQKQSDAQDVAPIEDTSIPIVALSAEAQLIVAAKGKMSVRNVSGSKVFYRGSKVVVRGEDFAGDVKNLTIEIHSETPQLLFTIDTAVDGSFEAEVTLPDNLEIGKHDIIIFYEGTPIVKKIIEISKGAEPILPTTADGEHNQNGINTTTAGIILLALLFVASIGALASWKVKKISKTKVNAGEL
jgi:hypothetical protein